MDKKYSVITISREYAAYGRTVAKGLSEGLGIPWYDRKFMKETARQSGYSVEDIEREGESMSPGSRFMNSFLNSTTAYTSSYDGIYKAQREVVLTLAENPCIIVGRTASHILREENIPSFDIFLYASLEDRLRRAAELPENEGLDVEKVVSKMDVLRSTYYKQYTGHELGDVSNYHICLDTGTIGAETCIDILTRILK